MVEVVGFLFGGAGVWYWGEELVTHNIAPIPKQESFNNNNNDNNNNLHLSCAHQRPERSHDTY